MRLQTMRQELHERISGVTLWTVAPLRVVAQWSRSGCRSSNRSRTNPEHPASGGKLSRRNVSVCAECAGIGVQPLPQKYCVIMTSVIEARGRLSFS